MLTKNDKMMISRLFCMSQDGIKPMWEDDRNKLGGRWLMTLGKQQRHNDLDRYWMETVRLWLFLLTFSGRLGSYWLCCLQLLCLIGESFDEASEDVCGAVVNVRPKGDKISIWTSNCQNKDAIMTIGYAAYFVQSTQRHNTLRNLKYQ